MEIFDTLSGGKKFLPKSGGKKKLKLFVCGPTVYDKAHIGHARTYIFFDVVARYLKHLGYKIYYLQNITDVDNKIIERADRDNVSFFRLAKLYEKYYLVDMKKLGVTSVTKYARATDHIEEIKKQIKTLLQKGNAYIIPDDGIYFDLKSSPEYGKLSRRTTAEAEDATTRIDDSINKRNKGDFVLWKLAPGQIMPVNRKKVYIVRGEPLWPSPWGLGRPGWHIEDTAITEKYFFGPQYDIHGGGIDLKFPHHEAEIAQEESASGKKPLAKIWMHTGVLLVNGKKMSKSLGNFVTVDEFLEKYSPPVLRLMVLGHHYRSPIDYSDKLAQQAEQEWNNLLQFLGKLAMVSSSYKQKAKPELIQKDLSYLEGNKNKPYFDAAMQNDFNTPQALSILHVLVNNNQKEIFTFTKEKIIAVSIFIKAGLKLLGLSPKLPKIPPKIKKLAKKRDLLRGNKQFEEADHLRKKIDALGYTIEDTPLGSFIWPR